MRMTLNMAAPQQRCLDEESRRPLLSGRRGGNLGTGIHEIVQRMYSQESNMESQKGLFIGHYPGLSSLRALFSGIMLVF